MNIQGDSLAEVLNGDAVNNKPRLANKERSASRKFKKIMKRGVRIEIVHP